jgi:hypothetical protein
MKSSFIIISGIGAGLINSIAWYALSRSLTFYEVATIDLYRFIIGLFLLITGIFICIFLKRKSNAGTLEFKDAFKTGVIFTFFMALVLAIFNYIYYKFIAADAVEFYVSEAKKQVLANKTRPEDLAGFEERVRNYFSSFKMFMSTLMLGVIISLVEAGILKKKPKRIPFSEN